MEGDDINLRIWGNDITANNGYSAIAMASSFVGPVYVYRNLIRMTWTGAAGSAFTPSAVGQQGATAPLPVAAGRAWSVQEITADLCPVVSTARRHRARHRRIAYRVGTSGRIHALAG